jgi:UDP-GlcNAc:undecaprenyl-phosphate GlcNAc-1-phosphate transferase
VEPTPYLGGVAMYVGILSGVALAPWLVPDVLFNLGQLRGYILGAGIIVALGVLDDLHDVPSLIKLAVHLGIGGFMYSQGFVIEALSGITGPMAIEFTGSTAWMAAATTVIWYTLVMNAINIIDGLDGLAAGICAIGALTLFCMTFGGAAPLASVLAVLILGACLGFLPHNFPPARIFMGDAGSLLLGLSLASLAVFSETKTSILAPLVIPVLALGVPIIDIGYAFIRRALTGRNPFSADRLHLHHRLLDLGLPTKAILGIFYYFSAYLGLLAWMLQSASSFVILLNTALLTGGFLLFLGIIRHLHENQSAGKEES